MRDTEKLDQMLDQIEEMRDGLDSIDRYQLAARIALSRAASHISAAIRQEQINENVDFCATLEE